MTNNAAADGQRQSPEVEESERYWVEKLSDKSALITAQQRLIEAWRAALKCIAACDDLATAGKIADDALKGRE